MSKTPRSGQRTRLPPEERQRAIISAARTVFESRGYEAWTVADVAEAAGVVEGTVLHYFKSKNNLINKVVEEFYGGITAKMEKGVKSVTGVRNQLRFVISTHLQTLIDNTDLCALMLRAARESNRELGEKVFELNKRYTRVIIDIIQHGKESGEVADNISTHLIRHMLFGTMEHFLWDLIHGRKKFAVSKVTDELTELVYTGIVNRPEDLNPEISQLIRKLNRIVD